MEAEDKACINKRGVGMIKDADFGQSDEVEDADAARHHARLRLAKANLKAAEALSETTAGIRARVIEGRRAKLVGILNQMGRSDTTGITGQLATRQEIKRSLDKITAASSAIQSLLDSEEMFLRDLTNEAGDSTDPDWQRRHAALDSACMGAMSHLSRCRKLLVDLLKTGWC